ncbi:MAG: nucleoside recognition domain-containing protein [Lachnospiraceae bacterium]|nr:nucleoside recognition domain-containing protein [Lachnospiraceae bacterium]
MTEEKNMVKFLLLSLIGVLLFFIPITGGKIPVVYGIDFLKRLAAERVTYVAVISEMLLACSLAGAKIFQMNTMVDYHRRDPLVKQIFFAAGIVLTIMICFDVNLSFVRNPAIGGSVIRMASTIFITIALAGTLVIFIIKSGIVEFVSVLLEPVMLPLFKLPGEAAVNMISSFVSSASVGVYFTEQYYENKTYTTRQACAVVTNFSVISVGYIGVLASIGGIEDMYGVLLISSFTLVLIMAAIMIRIPPLCLIEDTCIDRTRPEHVYQKIPFAERVRLAAQAGMKRSEDFTWDAFRKNFLQAVMFAQKAIGVMIPLVILVLTLVYETPLFKWLGYPLVPLLQLLRIPDAAAAAPSVLVGIVEISLPTILVSGGKVAAETVFFIVQLSIVQIIFFSEAGNAILSSRIPLKAGKLIEIFLVRTVIAMPLVAALTHFLYR